MPAVVVERLRKSLLPRVGYAALRQLTSYRVCCPKCGRERRAVCGSRVGSSASHPPKSRTYRIVARYDCLSRSAPGAEFALYSAGLLGCFPRITSPWCLPSEAPSAHFVQEIGEQDVPGRPSSHGTHCEEEFGGCMVLFGIR